MEEEDKHSKANLCISFNRRFSVAEKLKVIKHAEENSLHAASNLYGISRQAIRYRIREKEGLMKVTNKMSTITLHQGKSSKTISYESEILDYVYYNRALGNAVTVMKLYLNYWTINEKYSLKSWSSLQKWWYRFIKRHFLTFRRNTHISQKLPENYLDKILEFLSYNIKLRRKYWFEVDAIANMDETPLYLNMPPSTTVQKIGSKRVNIKTQGQ